ncbi:hypothetical protein DPMN_009849 [Dreissena polymorpha]|uniref:Uncharacterized protein n=1 Tax=Dreissena polymorpha TaxID=45954 RepID=A0A9D4N158_DREPO|nr:hypothetical protein DPMN_009849 [Dreissena polymorpha]
MKLHRYIDHDWQMTLLIFRSLVLELNFEGLCKQFQSRCDATERGVSSGSKLFAILIVFFEKNLKEMLILEIQQTTF